ncbi:MAG: hypothetical protein IIC51_01595 [Planctomycetes bacterium]|nr:hypothetical protein [Planctomycetota bacterium]
MKLTVYAVFAVVFGLLATGAAEGQTTFSFDNELHSFIAPSPSAELVAVVSKFETSFYALRDDGPQWRGPYVGAVGYLGVESDAKRPTAWPPFLWGADDSGAELFFPSQQLDFALKLQGNRVELVDATSPASPSPTEAQTGRLSRLYYKANESQSIEEILTSLHFFSSNRSGFVTRNEVRSADLPQSLHMVADVSPKGDQILCRPTSKDPIVSLNLRTAETTTYPVHDHPRVFPDYMTARYSPDGEYVLMSFSYHDDHYIGTHLQVFAVGGQFIKEFVAFGERMRGVYWLHNDWIVYCINDKIIFEKFMP